MFEIKKKSIKNKKSNLYGFKIRVLFKAQFF